MSGVILLLIHSLKRARTLVLSMGILLAGFQLILIVVARSIQRSGGFEELSTLLPPWVREMLGPSLAGFMSFAGIVSLGYFHLAVIGSLVGLSIAVSTMPASEIETGFMDLILSRPLARHWIITRTIIVMTLSIVLVLSLMMTGTWVGLETLAPKVTGRPSARLILSLATNLGLLMLSWSGVALAIGSASRRRSIAGGVAGLLALATFFLDYVGLLWKPAESAAWLSPFRYYRPFDLVMGNPLPSKNLVVLGTIAVAGFVAAYVLFSRRDISH
jgi:ABC-2 type transport system permease protein